MAVDPDTAAFLSQQASLASPAVRPSLQVTVRPNAAPPTEQPPIVSAGISYEDAMGQAPSQAAPVANQAPAAGISYEDAMAPTAPAPADPGQPWTPGNTFTGLARVPGMLSGLTHDLGHVADWAVAKGLNMADGGNRTGADIDAKYLDRLAPSGDRFNQDAFGAVSGVSQALGGPPIAPYDPTTTLGKIWQGGVSAAGAGAIDPMADARLAAQGLNILKQGIAGGVATGVSSVDPDTPILGPLAAVLTHAGLSSGVKASGALWNNTGRPIFNGSGAAETTLASRAANVPTTAPAMASPSQADLGHMANTVQMQTKDVGPGRMGPSSDIPAAQRDVQSATDEIGPGGDLQNTMEEFQHGLVDREGSLTGERKAAADPHYQEARGDPLIGAEEIPDHIKAAPDFNRAIRSARRDMLNGAHRGKNPYGAPMVSGKYTPALLSLAATKLAGWAADARADSRETGTPEGLTAASAELNDFLDKRSKARRTAQEVFQEKSEPLGVFDNQRVAAATEQYLGRNGKPVGFKQEPTALLTAIAKSKTPGLVVKAFIDAAGGDVAKVAGTLREAIIGQLRDAGAIDAATGEVNARLLASTVKNYLPTIKAYLPKLGAQLDTAAHLQETLDALRGQESLLDRIVQSRSPGSLVRQAIDVAGDKAAIVGPLQDAIVSRLRAKGVIDPRTGEIDAKGLAQETQGYLPTLGMYMPELQKKFGNAVALQKTLDTMRVQRGLMDSIANKGLQDAEGHVTGKSVGSWIKENRSDLEASQEPGTLVFQKALADAIGDDPGTVLHGVVGQGLPAAIAQAVFGTEGGILGFMGAEGLTGKIASKLLSNYRKSYTEAVERAFTDPAYLQSLKDKASLRPDVFSAAGIRNALQDEAIRGTRAAMSGTALSHSPLGQ